jgi:hypothetical protein
MIDGLSASSYTLFWCFLPLYTRENGVKTIKMSVFYHAKRFALHTVAHGCTRHEEGNAARSPVLRHKSTSYMVDGLS